MVKGASKQQAGGESPTVAAVREVLLYLLAHGSATGTKLRDELAARCGDHTVSGRDAVCRAIQKLSRDGLIEAKGRTAEGSTWKLSDAGEEMAIPLQAQRAERRAA